MLFKEYSSLGGMLDFIWTEIGEAKNEKVRFNVIIVNVFVPERMAVPARVCPSLCARMCVRA